MVSPSGDGRLIGWTRTALYPEVPHLRPRKSSYKPSWCLSFAADERHSLVRPRNPDL